jgi:hypothetical protein
MEEKIEKALDNFVNIPENEFNEIEFQKKVDSDKKKFIKSDNSIIERLDRIIIAENGKQLLREQY